MNGLGLVYCRHATGEAVREKNPLSIFFKKVAGLFKKEDFESWVKRAELDDTVLIHLIKIPYSIDELARLSAGRISKIADFISGYCKQNNIEACVLAEKISGVHGFERFNKTLPGGRFLYQALLMHMLDVIYSKKGKSIHVLDIAIVHGESPEELKAVISLLSPHVRYMTVLTGNKEQVEDELSGICDETGLSVRITGDRKSLKSANLVINLGRLRKVPSGSRLGTGTVLINFREPSAVEIAGENTIINGIDVKLPKPVEAKLDKELFSFFSACEIAELLLSSKCGCVSSIASIVSDAVLMENISRLFVQDRYIISRFIGKYNVLKAEDIKI